MAMLLAGFGLAWDYSGESVLTISSGQWGIIGFIAFGLFIVLTLVREIDLALQPRPKIKVLPTVSNGRAMLEVYNTGGDADFTAKGRVFAENTDHGLYTMCGEACKYIK